MLCRPAALKGPLGETRENYLRSRRGDCWLVRRSRLRRQPRRSPVASGIDGALSSSACWLLACLAALTASVYLDHLAGRVIVLMGI